MRNAKGLFCAITLVSCAIALALLPLRTTEASGASLPQESGADSVPAYHASPPRGSLPETLNPDQFTEPLVQNGYRLAAKVKKVLYQEPCYCHCDRSAGHTSLLDCFADKHGSECGTCLREAFYVYEETHKGMTPSQIRAGIEKGDWQKLDLTKFTAPPEKK
ncbi:MAG TPA: CYCXC family (seleno)protein [Candidatus Acidoferrum sp.]|nr:CYCXC family (seleno)protein [Candidatus Acidoferrum sp.]